MIFPSKSCLFPSRTRRLSVLPPFRSSMYSSRKVPLKQWLPFISLNITHIVTVSQLIGLLSLCNQFIFLLRTEFATPFQFGSIGQFAVVQQCAGQIVGQDHPIRVRPVRIHSGVDRLSTHYG